MGHLRKLGNTDIQISPIGLGCWQFSGAQGLVGKYWPALEEETVLEIVRVSLEGGVNWFDTAELYGGGTSERTLSHSLKTIGYRPDEMVVATKWRPVLRFANHIRSSISERLEALDGLRIDLHQIHSRGSLSSISSQMHAMADILDEGKIRSVGVSNFGSGAMQNAHAALASRGIPLASNQMKYHLLDRRIENNGVMATARKLGITIIAYSPLAQGLLSGKFHQDPELIKKKGGPRQRMGPFRSSALRKTQPLINTLTSIGEAYGATAAQVSLNWLTNFHGDVVVAIPGATSVKQAKSNAESFDFTLTRDEMARIDAASRSVGG